MQLLNKMIIENKALQNENEALKAENAKVKQHISQLDENAVRRVTAQKDAVIESLNTHLVSKTRTLQDSRLITILYGRNTKSWFFNGTT